MVLPELEGPAISNGTCAAPDNFVRKRRKALFVQCFVDADQVAEFRR